MSQFRTLPDCWGHRGASARFPENTLASFEGAMRDGAEGIESDLHTSSDGVLLCFHDPELSRTTDSKGLIKERPWYGENGIEHVRTVKEPRQAIPTFDKTLELLMRPENQHVKFNVDIKVQNEPDRLFSLMHKHISAQPEWETKLAPRIILGLWHPRYLEPAKRLLPYCGRSHIGVNPSIARKYFWNDVESFSIAFPALATWEGQSFRQECQTAGKKVFVWTVNEPDHMMEAVRWGVDAIITDMTQTWLDLRKALQADYDRTDAQYGRYFLWTTPRLYAPLVKSRCRMVQAYLERVAGPFDSSAATLSPIDVK